MSNSNEKEWPIGWQIASSIFCGYVALRVLLSAISGCEEHRANLELIQENKAREQRLIEEHGSREAYMQHLIEQARRPVPRYTPNLE